MSEYRHSFAMSLHFRKGHAGKRSRARRSAGLSSLCRLHRSGAPSAFSAQQGRQQRHPRIQRAVLQAHAATIDLDRQRHAVTGCEQALPCFAGRSGAASARKPPPARRLTRPPNPSAEGTAITHLVVKLERTYDLAFCGKSRSTGTQSASAIALNVLVEPVFPPHSTWETMLGVMPASLAR